jgi:Protein kinase domain
MTSTPDDGNPADGDLTSLDPGRDRRVRRRRDRDHADGDATSLDPGRQRRPGRRRGAPPGAGLPTGLAARFVLINEVPGIAGEASLYVVREHGDDRPPRVLKLYADGRVPDPAVWAWLRGERDPRPGSHIVKVLETGHEDGQAYEVMEHLAGDDLGTILTKDPQSLDPATLAVIVEQLAEALSGLHAAGIVHCDVKPANVVVRALLPLDVALVDFGVARYTGTSVSTLSAADGQPFTSDQLLTFRYAAPEWLIARSLGPPADWWSLGMTVAELAGRRHPFAHWTDEVILKHFANTRPVDLSQVTDPRFHLLGRGLLQRDDADRWGTGQVGAWVRGTPPDVADDRPAGGGTPAAEPSGEAFAYRESSYTNPEELAIALMTDWGGAVSWLFQSRDGPARQHRHRLREWLATLDGPQYTEPGRSELIHELGRRLPADIKLYRLLRWLYPSARPIYRGVEVTSERLPGLARAAAGAMVTSEQGFGQGAIRDVVHDLWHHRLLAEMVQATGGTGLSEVDQRWRYWHARWQELSASLARSGPAGELADRADTVLSYLLWLAAEEESARAWLTRQAARDRASLPLELPWFSGLTGRNAGVLSLLRAVLLYEDAQREAQQVIQDRATERIRRQQLLEGQAVAAWFRRHDRPTALGWAGGATALVAIFWSGIITICDILPFATTASIGVAWACVILSVMVLATAELGLASVIGGPYHPRYSLIGAGITRAADAVQAVRQRGLLFIAMLGVALAAALAVTSYLPFLLPLLTTAGELAWCAGRYRCWRADAAEVSGAIELAARERQAGGLV